MEKASRMLNLKLYSPAQLLAYPQQLSSGVQAMASVLIIVP